MLVNVRLNGWLGEKYGRRWRFDIATPAEAVRALECARPGFQTDLIGTGKLAYQVRVGRKVISERYLKLSHGAKSVSITPVIEGADSTGKIIGEIILGVVLVAAAVYLGPVAGIIGNQLAAQIGLFGVAMALGGISALLAPSPTVNPSKSKNKGSYLFQTAINTLEQGGPVALTYGRPWQGSQVISADVFAQDIQKGSKSNQHATDNTGTSVTTAGQPAQPAYNVQPY